MWFVDTGVFPGQYHEQGRKTVFATSKDGIHWEKPVHVNPALRGVSDDLWGFLYDPNRRKYLLYTRRVPNLPRDISLY